ncbi:MAG: carboxypeptidase-like regulatory domain-containing protein [Methanobrevibacter sp.]|uniref:carboxypeptidase-like regulatory domain-containing protein n=1 Tax=Methanobrevibacter sp. TaxID=66852 RepID=UPI003F0FC7DB
MAVIPNFEDLPYSIRNSPRKRWNYLKKLLSDDETPVTRNVSISVNDGSNPVSGASVKIGSDTKTTGSAGGCSFKLADGDYQVTVSADGFTTKTESITVSSEATSFTISLTSA